MSVIDTLITDRTAQHTARLKELSAIGWGNMTVNQQHEWMYGNDNIYWADGEIISCLDGDIEIDSVSNKGAYNATDLNRVTEAIKYLVDRLSIFGYAVKYKPILIDHKVAVYATDEAGNVIMAPEKVEDDITGKVFTVMSAVFDHWNEWIDETWIIEDTPTSSQMMEYLDNVQRVREALELPGTTPAVPGSMDRLTFDEANDIERILVEVERTINQVVAAFRRSNAPAFWSGNDPLPTAENYMGRTWEELDAMNTTWANWQVADWYLLLYGNLKAEGEVTDGV